MRGRPGMACCFRRGGSVEGLALGGMCWAACPGVCTRSFRTISNATSCSGSHVSGCAPGCRPTSSTSTPLTLSGGVGVGVWWAAVGVLLWVGRWGCRYG